jgi:hypothetical protein
MPEHGFWRTVRDAIDSTPRTVRLLAIIITIAAVAAILAEAGIHIALPMQ